MKRKNRRHLRLGVKVTADGVLTIEIGIETLASASLRSDFAYQCADPEHTGRGVDPREVFEVTQARGFALETKAALLEEAEDGSSLLTELLDKATERAIEDGSMFWRKIGEEP